MSDVTPGYAADSVADVPPSELDYPAFTALLAEEAVPASTSWFRRLWGS